MQTASISIQSMGEATAPQQFTAPFPPLALVNKPNLTTAEASHYFCRRPQTLLIWACRSGTGPMKPTRIGGRLAWNTATVKALTGVAA